MSLLDVLRAGIAVADGILKPLEALVTYERHIGTDGFGTDIWAAPIQMRAICDWKQSQVTTASGGMSLSKVTVTFIDIKAMEVATGGQGISDQDRITLPDGTTGPIMNMSGFIDAITGQPVATDVYLG
jgi:hypothetical protein